MSTYFIYKLDQKISQELHGISFKKKKIIYREIKRPLQDPTPYITLADITKLKQNTTSTRKLSI
jgi:hypothetical protein